MIDGEMKEQLVAEFRDWLESLDDEDLQPDAEEREAPDMLTFFGELVALRQEFGLQTRSSSKNAREMNETLSALRESLSQQSSELEAAAREVKSQLPQARTLAEDTVLLEVINLREALAENILQFGKQQLKGWFIGEKDRAMLREQQRQLELFLKKADDVLRRFDVTPVARTGEPFDASRMRATAVTEQGDAPAGCVTQIYLQGFKRNNKLLTTAEVEVRK